VLPGKRQLKTFEPSGPSNDARPTQELCFSTVIPTQEVQSCRVAGLVECVRAMIFAQQLGDGRLDAV
jgi:hypothetical protein